MSTEVEFEFMVGDALPQEGLSVLIPMDRNNILPLVHEAEYLKLIESCEMLHTREAFLSGVKRYGNVFAVPFGCPEECNSAIAAFDKWLDDLKVFDLDDVVLPSLDRWISNILSDDTVLVSLYAQMLEFGRRNGLRKIVVCFSDDVSRLKTMELLRNQKLSKV